MQLILLLSVVVVVAAGRFSPASAADEDADQATITLTPAQCRERFTALAVRFYRQGQYGEAAAVAGQALECIEKTAGPQHPDTADAIVNLAEIQRAAGRIDEAAILYPRALGILEKHYGPDDTRLIACLNNMAVLSRNRGAVLEAESLYRRVLGIQGRAFGGSAPEMAVTLQNLAVLYTDTGDLKLAGETYGALERILTMAPEAVADPAALHDGLGQYYRALGAFEEAEHHLRQGLALREARHGAMHVEVAHSLMSLGGLLQAMGEMSAAERIYLRALNIVQMRLGADHPVAAVCFNNLAALCVDLGQFDRAETYYNQAMDALKAAYGPHHPEVAEVYGGQAVLYFEQGQYGKARMKAEAALTLRQELSGDTLAIADALHTLAGIDWAEGDLDTARARIDRALEMRSALLGNRNPGNADLHAHRAMIEVSAGNADMAMAAFTEALALDAAALRQVYGTVSEERRVAFVQRLRANLYCYLSFVQQKAADDAFARKAAYDAWLQRKGMLLDTHRQFQEALLVLAAPDAVAQFQQLSRLRVQLNTRLHAGPGGAGTAAFKKEVSYLNGRIAELENSLAGSCEAFARQRRLSRITAAEVVAALPPGALLIDYALVNPYDYAEPALNRRWGAPRLLAFVLAAGEPGVRLYDLGAAGPIAEDIAAYREALKSVSRKVKENDQGKIADYRRQMQTRGKALFDTLVAPVLSGRPEPSRVFVSPDGALNVLPFETLQDADGRFLVERFTLHYLTAGRDLTKDKATGSTGEIVLMGAPDFDTAPEASAVRGGEDDDRYLGTPVPRELRGMKFGALPGTAVEIEEIGKLMDDRTVVRHLGGDATESALRNRATPPRILHLATHGFFYDPQKQRNAAAARSTRSGRPDPPRWRGNPLQYSGLAMSGANRPKDRRTRSRSDGILTAEEILELNFKGTDLVVMSACETAMGQVQGGEGVYGLRRAFLQAGAENLVMSMWAVQDRETQELMVAFYEQMIREKKGGAEALRQAMLRQMEIVRERYGYPDPYYWGGFVFLGKM